MNGKSYPIDEVLPQILAATASGRNLVIEAPPGAGKTTRVPPALLSVPELSGKKILLIEPRRIAAIRAAEFMAEERGESAGMSIGYRVRGATKVSPATRLEVMTEGVFLRILLDDPELSGVGAVIFDEVHERSLLNDLSMALSLESQEVLRPDLCLIAMSATLDAELVAKTMRDATRITSAGRMFPVEIRYVPLDRLENEVSGVVRIAKRALKECEGDLLCFLPGAGEIFRAAERLNQDLAGQAVIITPLLGEQSLTEQRTALSSAPAGFRKIVISSAIAESSVTVPGVRVVIDGGLSRVSAFDKARDMSALETITVSRASADQRCGRAGRVSSGVCYRLWSAGADAQLKSFHEPQIVTSDLTSLALYLAAWGVKDPFSIHWLTTPPASALSHAFAVLQSIDAVDAECKITQHGEKLSSLPLHPRLAHMVIAGNDQMQCGSLACEIAAVLEEPKLTSGIERETDLAELVSQLNSRISSRAHERAQQAAKELKRMIHLKDSSQFSDTEATGMLVALAYPERIAKRRDAIGEFVLAQGTGATLPATAKLAQSEWLAVATITGASPNAKIRVASAISQAAIENIFRDKIVSEEVLTWDEKRATVLLAKQRRFGPLYLSRNAEPARTEAAAQFFATTLQQEKIFQQIAFPEEATHLISRVKWLKSCGGEFLALPSFEQCDLRESVADWLLPYIPTAISIREITDEKIRLALWNRLSVAQQRLVNEAAPARFRSPTDREIRIDYDSPQAPAIEIKLQELFGEPKHPVVGGKLRIPLTLFLLSPAKRPVQITKDLPGFWIRAYPEVRKELKARYPKHSWPEDPTKASATRR